MMIMWHTINPLATSLFGIGSAAAGATITLMVQKLRRRSTPHPNPPLDAGLDGLLAARAQQWADQRGTPDLGATAHHRLRTAAWLAARTRAKYQR